MSQSWDKEAEHYKQHAQYSVHVQMKAAPNSNLRYYGIDHTPHCRPRAAAMLKLTCNSDLALTLLETRRPAEQAAACLSSRMHLYDMVPIGPGKLDFAHGTTILTNREPSKLVGECIFYALQVRTRV